MAGGGSVLVAANQVWLLCAAAVTPWAGYRRGDTASYAAAGSVIPARAHGTGFGVLTSASLGRVANSPFIAGLLGGTSIRAVFFLNVW